MSRDEHFFIKTYGCQMNVHDSQKLAGLLSRAGLSAAAAVDQADVLVINTCSIRDKAENQLYSDLGKLRAWKERRPGRVIGVGGCVAQQVGDAIMRRFGHVDFVFGTHNLRLVPSMLTAARTGERRVDVSETRSLERFDLPARPADAPDVASRRAFVTVMEGCDMFCSFCIVPTTRGREISRPAEAILAEVEQLAGSGVREVTLLGQTVNAYGRHDVRRSREVEAGTMAFSQLLARIDVIPGIERIRYTSPHPVFFDEGLIRAHGEIESLCPHVHLPLQSGSNRVLEAMSRRYGREAFLAVVEGLRSARPDIALTTDLIVGFPGETEAEFEETLSLVAEVGFVDHYSFKYSPRPGTRAAAMTDLVEPAEAQRRLVALQDLQRGLTLAYHRSRIGTTTEILIEGTSRKGSEQLCGRDPHHRIVNLANEGSARAASGAAPTPRPGDLVEVEIVEATPHSLIGEVGRGSEKLEPDAASAVKLRQRSADEPRRSATLREGPTDPLRVIH